MCSGVSQFGLKHVEAEDCAWHVVGNGCILVDGHDIQDLDLTWLHRRVALISQEPVLFATTIKQNILYGVGTASDDDIRRACRMANALQFIEAFPEQFDTLVGERGVRLSGGQKQRVAIARAILMNPKVLHNARL